MPLWALNFIPSCGEPLLCLTSVSAGVSSKEQTDHLCILRRHHIGGWIGNGPEWASAAQTGGQCSRSDRKKKIVMENQSMNISEHLPCARYFSVSKTGEDPYPHRADILVTGETVHIVNK